MPRENTKLIASAGEHYVAYKLARLDCIAALVREGSPSIDILASTKDGAYTVGLQVKTAFCALRSRGRGENRAPAELEFPLGHRAISGSVSGKVIVCFVDLRGYSPEENAVPDVYIIPTRELVEQFKNHDVQQWPWLIYKKTIEEMAPHKNKWTTILEALSQQPQVELEQAPMLPPPPAK